MAPTEHDVTEGLARHEPGPSTSEGIRMNPMNDDLASLTPQTLKILEGGGWTLARRFDARPYEQALEALGYPILYSASQFLASFGGIHGEGSMNFHFDPTTACGLRSSWARTRYAAHVGTKLCPVGESGDNILLMDQFGRVYAGFDNLLARLGGSLSEGLELICRGGRAKWETVREPRA